MKHIAETIRQIHALAEALETEAMLAQGFVTDPHGPLDTPKGRSNWKCIATDYRSLAAKCQELANSIDFEVNYARTKAYR